MHHATWWKVDALVFPRVSAAKDAQRTCEPTVYEDWIVGQDILLKIHPSNTKIQTLVKYKTFAFMQNSVVWPPHRTAADRHCVSVDSSWDNPRRVHTGMRHAMHNREF